MDMYVYDHDLYCVDCGHALRRALLDEYGGVSYGDGDLPERVSLDDGEYDTPRHCAECHEFLPVRLTAAGYRYVACEYVERYSAVTREWMDWYGPDYDLTQWLDWLRGV